MRLTWLKRACVPQVFVGYWGLERGTLFFEKSLSHPAMPLTESDAINPGQTDQGQSSFSTTNPDLGNSVEKIP